MILSVMFFPNDPFQYAVGIVSQCLMKTCSRVFKACRSQRKNDNMKNLPRLPQKGCLPSSLPRLESDVLLVVVFPV